ncbi:hypothetical protein [Thermophilibacter immobilis]|uniref:Uncharacterized protein n=1 Tax=Thermophilibacter immobilis TaxID=2779519 RepID=A0A7S7M9S5_9ACTN|nr:hypothetical protein [Thermophilibacter immobilis]QOY61228.1 hypothetical protein INP52_03245 [Thermophilibacter immobilis]
MRPPADKPDPEIASSELVWMVDGRACSLGRAVSERRPWLEESTGVRREPVPDDGDGSAEDDGEPLVWL